MNQADIWSLYHQMLRSRLFEEAVKRLWEDGLISGEMHLGIGEEAIAAGINAHLEKGDALALDHRGTAPLLMRGVDGELLLKEFLGLEDGLCRGRGGHMHLFSKKHLAASSGIVGAAGPTAAGFALAARTLRPGTLAVAYFGEGALNQGMLMEAMNLASAWKLPVLFVCKNNQMAITTQSPSVTGGDPEKRANGFGIPSQQVDGMDAEAVWDAADEAVSYTRGGGGPFFLHARCRRPDGHFLGDPLIRMARSPVREMAPVAGPLLKSFVQPKGASISKRVDGLKAITAMITQTVKGRMSKPPDPIKRLRTKLKFSDNARLKGLEAEARQEIRRTVDAALAAGATPNERVSAPRTGES